jgi:hypothetical protein
MENIALDFLVENTKRSFANYGLDHDLIMGELKKYNGVIAGSFMYMNFFYNLGIKCNDIDIYIHKREKHYGPILDPFGFENYHHPFEKFIMKNINGNRVKQTESYIFMDGIILSRTYKCKSININVILTDMPVIDFIYENFDLDCCKIIYDGTICKVFNINDLIARKTECRYNKCSLKNIYQNHKRYYDGSRKIQQEMYSRTIYGTEAFKKFKILFKLYRGEFNDTQQDEHKNYSSYLKYISNAGNLRISIYL